MIYKVRDSAPCRVTQARSAAGRCQTLAAGRCSSRRSSLRTTTARRVTAGMRRRRKPLSPIALERLGEAANNPARVKDIFELGIAMTLKSSFDDRDFTYELVRKLKAEHAAKAAELQLENAQLKAALAEIRAKVNEIAFVQERLQLDRCGPPGAGGPRGADGPRGEVGLRGERGPPGLSAPFVTTWIVDERAFTATPVTAEGKPAGAVLRLRGFFEAFNDAINDADDAADADAAAASRARTEREVDEARSRLR